MARRTPAFAIATIATVTACTADDADVLPDGAIDGPTDGAGDAPADAPSCTATATYSMSLAAGAFPALPGKPNVIVHVPDGFDRAAPIDVVVYIHGFNNCITNVLGDTNTVCSTGGLNQAGSALGGTVCCAGTGGCA